MTNVRGLAIAASESKPARPCATSQSCELVAELRQSIDLLQRQNRDLRLEIAELDHLASTDKLTGAWNRRRMEEVVHSEMERMKRYGRPLSLLVVDIDLFKRVNDKHGHAAGDALLVELSGHIRSVLRATDSLTRWGGEEFVVLCPDTTLATAAAIGERLRSGIIGMKFAVPEAITVSIGVAECLPDEIWEQWFGRADARLLLAKSAGRNQIGIAPEVPLGPQADEAGAKRFLNLVWHPAYASGDEVIDREHQTLFRDANDLLAAILAGRAPGETRDMVDALVLEVVQHFRDEESILAAGGYPGAAKHAAIHRTLVDRAGALMARFHAGEANVREMFQFLAHDVVAKHMLGDDREFFHYLHRRRETAAERQVTALPH